MPELQRCPICGKYPKIKRDIGYEYAMFGAWCTIQCKPFLRKPHLKIEEGKATWARALEYGIVHWNEAVAKVKDSLPYAYMKRKGEKKK